ncbi:cell division cycle-associated protein 4 [Nematolebias whitei]|uniref:cell division cycle-associated protein 4 n=1 Tax=Nematolebias whitei TaxID=451745 RepID=UPI00189B148D|nr:cell division cycle-associated protein 4 [Nematolebias whitei]
MTRLFKDTSMLGRGVKRKRSCLEELEAEVLPDAARRVEKKPHGDEDGDEEEAVSRPDMSHLQQRQVVLSLCLKKLQDYQVGMELSLRRSVLLVNTLRQIQEEMQSDRTRGPDLHLHNINPDSCLLRDSFVEDVSVTCPGCAVGNCEGPDSLPFPECPSLETNISTEQQKLVAGPSSNTFSDATNTVGYLSDLALDDIFEDIDTSMYETSDLLSACAAGSLWPISVSLWPDENMKSHSPIHSTGGGLQSCLMDLNELDHIIEILVKS